MGNIRQLRPTCIFRCFRRHGAAKYSASPNEGQTTAIKEQVTTKRQTHGPFNTQVSNIPGSLPPAYDGKMRLCGCPGQVVDDKMLEGGTMLVFVAAARDSRKLMPYFRSHPIGADASPRPGKGKATKEELADLDSQQNTVEASLMLSRRIHPLLKRSFQFVSLGVRPL